MRLRESRKEMFSQNGKERNSLRTSNSKSNKKSKKEKEKKKNLLVAADSVECKLDPAEAALCRQRERFPFFRFFFKKKKNDPPSFNEE